jgi:type IV pilus assembly protein PilX
MQVCNQPLTAASAVLPATWANIAVSASAVPTGSIQASGGVANSYAAQPQVYIAYLQNNNSNPPSALIQVTAAAQGGNSAATSVVQTVYQVTASSRDIGKQ